MVNWFRQRDLILPWILHAVIAQSQLTYWIHPSCQAYPRLGDVIADFQHMARAVVYRNRLGPNDPAFARAFEVIMKTPQSDNRLREWNPTPDLQSGFSGTAWHMVDWIVSSFAALQPTPDGNSSNLRFICDQDPYLGPNARWQKIPDIPGQRGRQRNSLRTPGVDQEFFDKENFVRRDASTLGCQEAGENSGDEDEGDDHNPTLMEMYRDPVRPYEIVNGRYGGYAVPANINPWRSVISICDITFNQDEDNEDQVIQTMDDLLESEDNDLNGISLSQVPWGTTVSAMMAHEMSHMIPFSTVDYTVPGLGAYGWNVVQNYPTEYALTSAEAYSFLMIFAELETRGYQLDSDPARARAGYLVKGEFEDEP